MKEEKEAAQAVEWPLHTSQEIDVLARAQSNGPSGQGYQSNLDSGLMVYANRKSPHRIEIRLTSDETDSGLDIFHLHQLVKSQDSDGILVMSYILRCIAAPTPYPMPEIPHSWIDFDDVIEKVTLDPRSTHERRELHARIWGYIRFLERAVVVGQRSYECVEKSTRKTIPTVIESTLWRVHEIEKPEQPDLPFGPEIPIRCQIVVTPRFAQLLTGPDTAQFLPLGEVLGAIPGGKPAGSWARALGIALISFWRRHPKQTASGELLPTRRELLEHIPAKNAPHYEIFNTDKPHRAIDYWCGALKILSECEFVLDEGEPSRGKDEIRKNLPRKNWQNTWLDEQVVILPGLKMQDPISVRSLVLSERPAKEFRHRRPKT